MAFEDRDTSEQVMGTKETTAEEIIFRRNREHDDGGPKLDVIVTKIIDGDRRSFHVPRAEVLNNWPGKHKTLETHLLAAIDNAGTESGEGE